MANHVGTVPRKLLNMCWGGGLRASSRWLDQWSEPIAASRINQQDTLFDVARHYGLGYPEIMRANPGVDIWSPGEGRDILLPGRRILPPAPYEGIVVNLPEHRLYFYPKPRQGEKQRRHHVPGEHWQNGLAFAARTDLGHRQGTTS